jgi:hypothetical protein
MSADDRGSGVLETVKEMAPALSGNPAAVWRAARRGTEEAAAVLPDAMGLDHVKDFIRRHPVLSTCVVLAVAYYVLGGPFGAGRWRR